MPSPMIYYLPCLHQELLPKSLPKAVSCIPCYYALHGLKNLLDSNLSANAQKCIKDFCELLPLNPAEARAALEETNRLGQELPAESIRYTAFAPTLNKDIQTAEADRIKLFAQSGEAPVLDTHKQTERDILHQRIAAQKSLLLAWQLEEYSMAIDNLHTQIAEKQRKLMEAIGEDQPEPELVSADTSQANLDAATEQGLPWKLVLEASLAFLPDNAIFFVQDSSIIDEIKQNTAEGRIEDVPESLVKWSQENNTALASRCTNLQKLIGYKSARAPWQQKDFVIFFPLIKN